MNKILAFCCALTFSLFVNTATVNAEEFNAEAKYAQTCAVCHNSGVAGAPKKGDTKAWAQRLAKGDAALVSSVKNGMGAMPAMGMCADCSDAQFTSLIHYMSK